MKMFKKKSELSLPPLPKPPTNDQMMEDIKGAEICDPVFIEQSLVPKNPNCDECNDVMKMRGENQVFFQYKKNIISNKHDTSGEKTQHAVRSENIKIICGYGHEQTAGDATRFGTVEFVFLRATRIMDEGSSKKMFEECSELDLKFEAVKEFIEASHTLKDLIKDTEEKLQEVQKSRDELKEMTENIKLEAAKALKS